MAKKKEWIIEYRYDTSQPWVEYCRTFVTATRDEYYRLAHLENPGATVRINTND